MVKAYILYDITLYIIRYFNSLKLLMGAEIYIR